VEDLVDVEVIDAELVEEDGLPAVVEPVRPRYLLTKHTMLAPGEALPVEGQGPQYTERDFRMSERSAERGRTSKAHNTRVNRESVMRNFEAWCEATGRLAVPCTTNTFTEYAVFLMDRALPDGRHHKASTIRTYMSHIRMSQPAGDRPDNAPYLERLAGYRGENPRANRTRQAFPLTLSFVLAMIDKCDESTPIGRRDAAMLAFGYRFLARRTEPADILIEDVGLSEGLVTIYVPKDKTHQDEDQNIYLRDRADLQLVKRLRAWLDDLARLGVTAGPLFRHLSKSGKLGTRSHAKVRGDFLTGRAVDAVVKKRFAQAGLETDGRPVTAQGLRAGGATDLAKAGVSGKELNQAGRWRDDSTVPERVYVRPVRAKGADAFKGVPLGGFTEAEEKPAPATTGAARAAARRRRMRRA
jgi:integrase